MSKGLFDAMQSSCFCFYVTLLCHSPFPGYKCKNFGHQRMYKFLGHTWQVSWGCTLLNCTVCENQLYSQTGANFSNSKFWFLVFILSKRIDLSKKINRHSLKLACRIIKPVPSIIKYSLVLVRFPFFTSIRNNTPKTAITSDHEVSLKSLSLFYKKEYLKIRR